MQIIEALLNHPTAPSEMIDVTRTTTYTKPNGSEGTLKETVGAYKCIFLPPETMNKNDGAILEQLMSGNDIREVYMIYCYAPNVKVGDTVYRRENGLYYEVKINAFYGSKVNFKPISHNKMYVVLKDNQKP